MILNNYTIGVIRDLQRFYMDGREIGTSFIKHSTGELWNPDFAKMAEAMGAGAVDRRATPATSARAFETALASGRPYVIDVKVNRDTAGAADRDLAVRADPAGGADLRQRPRVRGMRKPRRAR